MSVNVVGSLREWSLLTTARKTTRRYKGCILQNAAVAAHGIVRTLTQ
jgi:hypothetical protein